MPIPIPVELGSGSATSGGFVQSAQSLPEGWVRGVSFLDSSCTMPEVMGPCPQEYPSVQSVGSVATFRPVSVVLAIECSTFGGVDLGSISQAELEASRDHALAREMLTGEASKRDAGPSAGGNPSLISEATEVTPAGTSVAQALAVLEQSSLEATAGRGAVLLASPEIGTLLKAENLIWRDGVRWRTAAGSLVVISSGLDGTPPADAGYGTMGGYLYSVPAYFAEYGPRSSYGDVDRYVNTATSRSEDAALVAFLTCGVFAVEIPGTLQHTVEEPEEPEESEEPGEPEDPEDPEETENP